MCVLGSTSGHINTANKPASFDTIIITLLSVVTGRAALSKQQQKNLRLVAVHVSNIPGNLQL